MLNSGLVKAVFTYFILVNRDLLKKVNSLQVRSNPFIHPLRVLAS